MPQKGGFVVRPLEASLPSRCEGQWDCGDGEGTKGIGDSILRGVGFKDHEVPI